jgi:hypothetical protein
MALETSRVEGSTPFNAVKSKGSGVVLVPTPDSAIESGDEGASLVMVNAPLRLPSAVGLKVTETVQVAAPASAAAGQLFVSEKSPLALTADTTGPPLPERVMVSGLLGEPMPCGGKDRLGGLPIKVKPEQLTVVVTLDVLLFGL